MRRIRLTASSATVATAEGWGSRIPVSTVRSKAILIFSLTFISLGWGQAAKAPTPAAADQKKAEKSIRELFAKEYAVSDRVGKKALVKKLIDEAMKTKDLAESFILIRDAIDISAGNLDFGSMTKAIALMADRFDIALEDQRAAAVAQAKKSIVSPEDSAAVADACLLFWEQGMAAENYDSAIRWAKDAEVFAKSSNNSAIIQAVKDMGLEAGEARRDRTRAEAAKATLITNPADEAANHDLGAYLSFVRQRWPEGIPYLAKGPAGPIKDLASKDFLASKEPDVMLELSLNWKAAADNRSV